MITQIKNGMNLSPGGATPAIDNLVTYHFMDAVARQFPRVVQGYKYSGAEFPLAELLLEDDEVEVACSGSSFGSLVASREGLKIFLCNNHGTIYVQVAAHNERVAGDEVNRIVDRVPRVEVPLDKIELGVWYLGSEGPERIFKNIEAQPWADVEHNYPTEVSLALSTLMKTNAPADETSGRIVLWYGPPGTGKTSALRTLAWEWREWCDVHVISDPEKLFSHPGYLLSVAGGNSHDKWRLVVAEDSDAFLHAHKGGSSDMGRLLNFSDGIIGQGTKTIFLLTTNEPVGKLHPAVTRPGRCMAQIEFGAFTEIEATAWLGGTHLMPVGPQTLAELMEHRRTASRKITSEAPLAVTGQYL